MDELFRNLKKAIEDFNQNIEANMPVLIQEVDTIIENKSQDKNEIERMLDILLSLTMHSFGDEIFIKLLDYYKTVSPAGAELYWKEYDEQE